MQFQVIVVTDPQIHTQTNPQTGPITIHCAAKLSVQCDKQTDTKENTDKLNTIT